ncbi:hypothetical protein NMY22_g11573 [Coprinellus aureogranulatus]|nr:hypothetical protein NMY22_g11573 [Coprinellus aureogranulatus]
MAAFHGGYTHRPCPGHIRWVEDKLSEPVKWQMGSKLSEAYVRRLLFTSTLVVSMGKRICSTRDSPSASVTAEQGHGMGMNFGLARESSWTV